MKKQKNEMSTLVDEEFLSKFSYNHRMFMEDYYYNFYKMFCRHYKRKPLPKNMFFTNMRRRRIKLIQLYCPYCGTIAVTPIDRKLHDAEGFNYCCNCGHGSTIDNVLKQISRFIRINRINRLGIQAIKEKRKDTEDWLIAYDCYQMEIIGLASIIEVVFRDYFEALLCINNQSEADGYHDYIKKVLKKNYGNDFLSIEKANTHYRKAFDINLREVLASQIWNDLMDIVALRNMFVHNNGRVDMHFKTLPTYTRLKERVDVHMLRLEDEDIAQYLDSVISAATRITNVFLEHYFAQRNSKIASFYFNNTQIDFEGLHNLEP